LHDFGYQIFTKLFPINGSSLYGFNILVAKISAFEIFKNYFSNIFKLKGDVVSALFNANISQFKLSGPILNYTSSSFNFLKSNPIHIQRIL